MIERKTFPLEIKGIEEDGHFTGYAATFNNVDLGNDKILPGAFRKTLKQKKLWPLFLYHRIEQPVGGFQGIEDQRGLFINGKLTLEVQRAREARALMKEKVLNGLSIGYETVISHYEGNVRIIEEVKLYEVSIVPFPMNLEAEVIDVKSDSINKGQAPTLFSPIIEELKKRW